MKYITLELSFKRDSAAIARIYGTPNPPIPEGWQEAICEQPREAKPGEYYLATPRELDILGRSGASEPNGDKK